MSPKPRPLAALLSQALIAFTIEFDHAFERQVIGPTGKKFAEWRRWPERPLNVLLVSMPMWVNYLRHIPPNGLTAQTLADHSRDPLPMLNSHLNALKRWRFVTVEPGAGETRKKPPIQDMLVRLTPAGETCATYFEPLHAQIEAAWVERFGSETVAALREELLALVRQLMPTALEAMPVISSRHEMFVVLEPEAADVSSRPLDELSLAALLSRILLAFTLEFDADFPLALAASANLLRPLSAAAVILSDLPRLSGVSEAAVRQGLTLFQRQALVVVEARPGKARGRQIRLTPKGLALQQVYHQRVQAIERDWTQRFEGSEALRSSLVALVGERQLAQSPLAAGLVPPAFSWRADLPTPEVLPEHPMILDRGAWPDAS
jgi:hypothetical protein